MDEVIPPNIHRFGQKNHRKPEPGASRGAGVGTVSVGSRCPRRKLCGGVNPSNPPHTPAKGFAPPAAIWKHPLPFAERY